MFMYTFVNGECPISYVCKMIIDNKYIAGKNITYYPEMEYLFKNKKNIDYYFGIMTVMYITTLFFVIFRTKIYSYVLLFTFFILFNYFLCIRNGFAIKNKNNKNNKIVFTICQEITKYILLFIICFLSTFVLDQAKD